MASQINGAIPTSGSLVNAEPIQQNFAHAKSEIEALQAAGPHDYSTTEINTGIRWNTKPVYQKTIVGGALSGTAGTTVPSGLPNTGAGSLDELLRWELVALRNGPPRVLRKAPNNEFFAWLEGQTIHVDPIGAASLNYNSFTTTLWYTKL